ncbi:MAG: hypothetical protein IT288_14685 [Bdellovibrionales bacterium]|nr:hypothetical protein [Bdellovibrionales bacterium]
MVKLKLFLSLFVFLNVYALPLQAGTDVGSGGDLVKCVPYSGNDLFGLYSLDYLVFARESGAKQPLPVKSWEESIFNIRRMFIDKLPELLPVFDEFTNNILNEDQSRRQIWEPTDYALVELDDEKLPISVKIPVNCRDNGKVQLVQAVIRQNPGFTGSPLIVYKYMPKIFEKMASERPLQLSFLLVHEFLWSISDNVDRNRRINWFLHSQELPSLSRIEIIDRLLGMGLDVQTVPRILDSQGRGHFSTLQDALAKARAGETIVVKEGVYSTGGASIVVPIKIRGEGDRRKIIIKGTKTYPAIDVNLEVDQLAEFDNVTIVRDVSPDNDDEYYYSNPLFVSSGRVLIKNSVIKSGSKYILRLNNQEKVRFEKCEFVGYKGIVIDLMFRGQIEVLQSTFQTERYSLLFDATRFTGLFAENTFQTECAVDDMVSDNPWDDSNTEEGKKRVLESKMKTIRALGPMFVNNKYPKVKDPVKDKYWCAP